MSTQIKHVFAVLKILSMENIVQITHFTAHNRKILVNCLVLLVGVLGSLGFASSALAETKYEIQSGDSLSKIISKNYPNTPRGSYAIIIADIIKNNPSAFSNKNANSLRLGKILTLPEKDSIAGLKKEDVTPSSTVTEKPAEPDTVATNEETTKASTETNKETAEASTAAEKISDVVADSSISAKAKEIKSEETATTSTSEQEADTKENAAIESAQKIEDLKAEVEQLRTLITKYEADQDNKKTKETASSDADTIEKLQAELEQQRALVTKYETDQADNKAADNKENNSYALEDLQTQNEQLRTLVEKYEADAPSDAANNSSASSDQALEDARTEIDLLKSLVKKYEADAEDAPQNTSEGNTDNSAKMAALTEKVEKLTQQNTQLQLDIKTAQTQLSESKQINAKATTVAAQQNSSPPIWKQFSWILPLIAIFIGLYLLLRLVKRIRDKKATKELKIALSSVPETQKSNTAAAFSVDGSMLPTASTVEKAPVEEDSVEAGVKIDMAKAYLDLDDHEAAQELLQEAVVEGSTGQRTIAENLLKKLS